MKIKIEIDVTPEELRRFIGLPDVAGIQDDMVQFVRDKMVQGSEYIDPATFVRENMDAVKGTRTWQKIMTAAFGKAGEDGAADGENQAESEKTKPKRRRRKHTDENSSESTKKNQSED